MARANAQGQDRRAGVALRWLVQQGITAVTATSNAELFYLHESFEYLPRPATGRALTDFSR